MENEPKMNIKEQAKEYEPKETKIISDLKSVSVDLETKHKVVPETDDNEGFEYNYIIVEDVEYRVPDSVLKQLKVLLEDEVTKDMKTFKVNKTGSGFKTQYQVIKLD